MQTIKSSLVLAAALAFLPSLQASIVIFTDFQSGICCSLGVNNSGPSPQSLAGQFVPNANYIMADAQVKVEENSTFVPTFNLFLYSDSSGAPGTNLGMIGGGTATSGAFNIVLVASPAFTLASGTPYWLVMTPNAGTNVFWAGGGFPSPLSDYNQNATGSSPWFTPAQAVSLQFQIDGTPAGTPEPGTFALMLPGLGLALLASRFRKTRARQPRPAR